MNKEKLYATATADKAKIPVEVGEIETPTGIVFDTTNPVQAVAPEPTPKTKVNPPIPKRLWLKTYKNNRKKERVNKRNARRSIK